jgi:hypothetical protein
MHDNFILKKNIFFHQNYKNFHDSENTQDGKKHPEHFWSALNSL